MIIGIANSIGYNRGGQGYNIFAYSEQFDNAAWPKLSATVSANAVNSPRGSLTADKIIASVGAGTAEAHGVRQTYLYPDAVPYTFSVYAKRAELNYCFLFHGGRNTGYYFNLLNGTVLAKEGTGSVTAGIVADNDGYYRCYITYTSTAINSAHDVRTSINGTTWNHIGDGISGIYLWGAMLNKGSQPLPYFTTTTPVIPQ